MNETYIKANCYECGESIEYPDYASKEEVACPHCNKSIILGECPTDFKQLVRIPQSDQPPTITPEMEIQMLRNQLEQERYNASLQVEHQRNQILNSSVQQQKVGNVIHGAFVGAFIMDCLFD